MKYEYDCVDLRGVVSESRRLNNNKSIGDNEIILSYLNERGDDGWRLMSNTPNDMIVYFERVKSEKRGRTR